nr:hypothetical protein [Sphingomonas koreensis]
MTARGNPAEQYWRVGYAWGPDTRRGLRTGGSNLRHQVRLDDLRARYDYRVAAAGGQGLSVGRAMQVCASIMLASQNAIDIAVVKPSTPQTVAVVIEIGSNRTGAHRPAVQTLQSKVEDQPDNASFVLADEELLTLFAVKNTNDARFITERDRAAVPVAADGIASPIAGRKHRGVVNVFLVHDRDHGPPHFAI